MGEACTNPDILRIIAFIFEILKIVYILIPIALIVMISLDFAKNVMSSKTDDMDKNLKKAIKRILYCICIYLIPTIAYFAINTLGNFGVPYTTCITNANEEKIDELTIDKAKELLSSAKEKITNLTKDDDTSKIAAILDKASTEISYIKPSSDKTNLETELKTVKKDYQDKLTKIAKEKEADEEENNKIPINPSGSDSNSKSDLDTEILKSGKSGKYFAPIQVSGYSFGSYSSTPGCGKSVKVYHDLKGIAAGTPIYAGMDGKAEFRQSVSNSNKLYSYGNQVRITNGTTVIIYAHLQKFPDAVVKIANNNGQSIVTESHNYPCSASKYSGTTTTKVSIKVKKGQLIGYLGTTGNSSGPHLHVEIKESGKCISDPWGSKGFGMR